MKSLTKKRKLEIANAIIANSEFSYPSHKHNVRVVREMLLEAMDKALAEAADDSKPSEGA